MSSGRLRTVNQASGAIAQTRNAISTQPRRQLAASAICATTGATRMPAVAEPNVNTMKANALRRTNQLAIAARGPSIPNPGAHTPNKVQAR